MTGPTPLYNSEVQPYAVLTGPYGYIARGAALRDQGYGQITLPWPGGRSHLVAAYMVWSIMDNAVPPDYGTLNGQNITGTWAAYATPSPCWSPTYIYAFVADVTADVVDGVNNLTGFPSGITDGADPWGSTLQVLPMDEGVSLIAIYGTGASALQQVTVYVGAETTSGFATLTEQLNYSTTDAGAAKTTYIIADGQLPSNVAVWNGTIIDPDAFPGSDPKETTTAWSYGNLSDTKTYNVTVTVGSNNTTASAYPTAGDCFTWIGQVLSVGVAGAPPPYPVLFEEQGLENGVTWSVTTNGETESGTVAHEAGSLTFDLGNGTYGYSVPSIAGYVVPPAGEYEVAGGPVFVRLLFHQVLYGVNITEAGLPAEQTWWAPVSNRSDSLLLNTTALAGGYVLYLLGNGSYNYSAGEEGVYLASPPSGSFVVNGANVAFTVEFVPPPLFAVTFVEHGLPSGTAWGGTVYSNFGEFYPETEASSVSVQLPNASMDTDGFYADSVAGFATPAAIGFGVFGTDESIDVNYTPLFDVNLTETGLPSDTEWTGYLENSTTGATYAYSYGTTLTFAVKNGSYNFTIEPVWAYVAEPGNGSVVVDGANVTVAIKFVPAPTYLLNFTEEGLRDGTDWGVMLYLPNGESLPLSGISGTLSVAEPNGSYSYAVTSIAGYTATPSYGEVTIAGTSANETIEFNRTFTVSFQETGLPTGTYWTLVLGGMYGYSSGSFLNLTVANGTYELTVDSADGYTPSPSTGSVEVNGANVSETIVFSSTTSPTFNIEFTETGLPTGSSWSVVLVEYTESTLHLSMNFTEPNGTYGFTVFGPDGYTPNPGSGSVDVSGTSVVQAIVFTTTSTPASYSVTFTETGLPSGAPWSVMLGGTPGYGMGPSIVIPETNGTYPFTVSATGYEASPSSGSVTVDGLAVTQPVHFTAELGPMFALTFVEHGLPSGTKWWVNITGEPSFNTTDGSAQISLANGTYAFLATPANRSFGPLHGSAVVHGATTVDLTFTTQSSGSGTGFLGLPGNEAYYALGGGGAVAAALLLLALLGAGRRRKKKEDGDQTGTPAGGSTGGPPSPPPPRG